MMYRGKKPLPATDRKAKHFKDAEKAYAWVKEIYDTNIAYLQDKFQAFVTGGHVGERVHAGYPYVKIKVDSPPSIDRRLSYGFASSPGTYHTTLTRPDLFEHYYKEQFQLLLNHHPGLDIEIGVSTQPIPLHFALGSDFHLENELTTEQLESLPTLFDLPDLIDMDDSIPNGTYEVGRDGKYDPLALFKAARVDMSLQRLKHYSGTCADHFQNFILFTNYQFYIDEFIKYARVMVETSRDYTAFVQPGDYIIPNRSLDPSAKETGQLMERLPQMPAYHLKRGDGGGITMVNIGVGPSNAKTITDHVAVIRPHAWLMLGHCAGLRSSQSLGDYVLAHAYVREDHVLDADLPLWVPVPPVAEVQIALEQSVKEITGLENYEVKKIMRTGTVASIDDRNWELRDYRDPMRRFSQSRAIALDMESATIAANGFRFRVPYGTLLCVSDKPMHGQIKLPGMADKFYRERVDQHLKIGLRALELMRENGIERLHSRKLRSFNEVAFQ